MTRSEYLKLCNEYEPGAKKAQVENKAWAWRDCESPDPLNYRFWESAGHRLRLVPVLREAGQWVFEKYPDWAILYYSWRMTRWELRGPNGECDFNYDILPDLDIAMPKDIARCLVLNEKFKA